MKLLLISFRVSTPFFKINQKFDFTSLRLRMGKDSAIKLKSLGNILETASVDLSQVYLNYSLEITREKIREVRLT